MADRRRESKFDSKNVLRDVPKDMAGKTNHELLKPLIFPNSERAFKLVNATVAAGNFQSKLVI